MPLWLPGLTRKQMTSFSHLLQPQCRQSRLESCLMASQGHQALRMQEKCHPQLFETRRGPVSALVFPPSFQSSCITVVDPVLYVDLFLLETRSMMIKVALRKLDSAFFFIPLSAERCRKTDSRMRVAEGKLYTAMKQLHLHHTRGPRQV